MRQYFNRYKSINVILVVLVSLIWFYTIYYYRSGLCAENCSFEFMVGVLDPIKTASLYLLPTLGFLLFLPSHYFRRWLWYIASWALPLSAYLVWSESVYTTALFSGRTFFAQVTMQVLMVLSVVFVIAVYLVGRFRR